jgi:hypothetical protein
MVTGLCLALLCAINLTGCNSGRGYQKADTATGQMEALKTELLAVKDRTEKIAPALKELVAAANSNPRSAYEKFSREFENTKKQSGKARRLADEIKKQAQAYFQAWEAQSSKVANPETRPNRSLISSTKPRGTPRRSMVISTGMYQSWIRWPPNCAPAESRPVPIPGAGLPLVQARRRQADGGLSPAD